MTDRTQLVRTVTAWRTMLGVALRRAVSVAGGRRIIIATGGCFLLVAAGQAAFLARTQVPPDIVVIVGVLVAAPALGLVYSGFKLPRSDVHADFFPTIAGWMLAGTAVAGAGLLVYELPADSTIGNPVQSIPVLVALSSFAGFAAGLHDARARTRERELEHRNRQLERTRQELESTVSRLRTSNERLEQFAYAASHDLQEPLRMVSSYLQLLDARHEDDLDDDAREYLAFAVDGADRMRAMIDGLLEYSRVETEGGSFDAVDLDDVLDDVCADLQFKIEETNAELKREPLPTVEGDENQLRQVFQNLLSNAIEYSGNGQPNIHVSADCEGSEWTVSVRDEGVGIDSADRDRIFDIFQRLHSVDEQAGSGIGLAVCKRIVERHGGEIWVESEPGAGSTFRFTLSESNRVADGPPIGDSTGH